MASRPKGARKRNIARRHRVPPPKPPKKQPVPAAVPRRKVSFENRLRYRVDWIVLAVLLAGLILRLKTASVTYFSLDESYHSRLSVPGFPALWRNSIAPTHPPLLILLLHYVHKIGSSEIAMRLIPALSGAVFPWFVYRWLRLVWGKVAAVAALVILVAAPSLVHLSCVVRAYTLALFFTAAALYFLERALRSGSARWMWLFAGSFFLAFLSEYSTALAAAAMGIYFLLSVWEKPLSRKAWGIWAGAQLVCLAAYAYLYVVRIVPLRAAHQKLLSAPSYMTPYFPRAGESALSYFARETLGVFQYVFAVKSFGVAGLVLFVAGLLLLGWRAWRRRSLSLLGAVLLLFLPFVLNCIAACAGYYPYGNTRQVVFLAMFVAIGVGIAVEWVVRHRIWITVLAIPLFVYGTYSRAAFNPVNWHPSERRELLRQALDYLERNVPPGGYILTEGNTSLLLEYHLSGDHWPVKIKAPGTVVLKGRYVFHNRPSFSGMNQIPGDLAALRERNKLPPDTPVWVMDTGGTCSFCRELERHKSKREQLSHLRRFGRTIVIFQVPAGYNGSDPPVAAGQRKKP